MDLTTKFLLLPVAPKRQPVSRLSKASYFLSHALYCGRLSRPQYKTSHKKKKFPEQTNETTGQKKREVIPLFVPPFLRMPLSLPIEMLLKQRNFLYFTPLLSQISSILEFFTHTSPLNSVYFKKNTLFVNFIIDYK